MADNVFQKLLNVQSKLKVPKGQVNKFGSYKYRSCEDILEGVKPVLKEVSAVLIIGDEILNINNHFYVKATAKFIDADTGEIIENSAFAREGEEKKGMDPSQVTGSTSSYARKYALNGLLCIDDTKDADTSEQAEEIKKAENEVKAKQIDKIKIGIVRKKLQEANVTEQRICELFGTDSIEHLTEAQFPMLLKKLDKTIQARNEECMKQPS